MFSRAYGVCVTRRTGRAGSGFFSIPLALVLNCLAVKVKLARTSLSDTLQICNIRGGRLTAREEHP